MKNYYIKLLSVFCALILCLTVVFSAVPNAIAAGATVYLRGTFNGWENPPEYAMTEDNNNHYLITIHLTKGSYEYKAATQDWSTFVAPQNNEGGEVNNAKLDLDFDCDVTFVADKASKTIQAFPHSKLEKEVKKVVLKSKWMEHDNIFLLQQGDKVAYGEDYGNYPDIAYWNIISDGNGAFYLQNNDTKNYAALSGSEVICVANADAGNTSWDVDTSTGAARFISKSNSKAVINVESLNGFSQASEVPMYYTSSQWGFEFSSYDYTLKNDRVIDSGYNAYADSPDSITSYMTGSRKTWTKSKNLSQYPTLKAQNSPLTAAVYNLTLEEAVKSINTDSYGKVFYTGTNWQKVWTRDTALSNLYSLAWVFPEISYNCEREKIKTNNGISVFEQDTGTGGSYPVSTDKIITMLSVWETYLADGNKEHLSYFYDICYNTIMQDMNVAYDGDAGLFRGETCGLDWRDQTYPDWTSETYDSGLSAIAESKTTSVNTIYCRVLEIMSKAAKVLGKGDDAEQYWTRMAQDLKAKVSDRLWNDNMGLYSSWEYPEYMGSPLAEKTDVLGNGFALWFNIGTDEQLDNISKNSPLVPYGADTVYPQKQGKLANADKIYHNFGIWPGWDSVLMVGAGYHNNKALAEEIFNSNVRGAATSLTQKEVINYRTGEGVASDQQLWSIAGTLAGYYRVMFGMNYDEDGITFNPQIPSWMDGPFELSNFKYRNATLKINLSGKGDKIKSFKVDGVSKDAIAYVFPNNSTGSHTIDIEMENSGKTYEINKTEDNLVVCPEMPTMSYNNGALHWAEKSGLTYKLWTGKEYIDVSGGYYSVDNDAYGCYSIMAVSADGLRSELSQPIVISPDRIKVEAESGTVSSGSLVSGGYVIDKRSQSANLTISVNIPKTGKYELSGIYNNPGDATSGISCAVRSVYVDGKDKGTLVFPEVYNDHKNQTSTHLTLDLEAGTHSVKIFYDTNNWYDRNMSITKNDVEYNYFNFDYVGGGEVTPTEPTSGTETTEPSTETQTQASEPTETTEPATETQTQVTDPTETTEPTTETQTQATEPSDETQGTETSSETQSTESSDTSQDTQTTEPTGGTQTSEISEDTQPPQTSITLTAAKKTIYVGGTTLVRATVYYGIGSTTFKSSNTKVATVNAAGEVKAKKAGSVIISAANNGKTATVKITIKKKNNPMTVKAKTASAKSKKTTTIKKAKAFTIKNAKGTVSFKKISGNKQITINKKTGNITVRKGLKKGTYKFKVKVTAAGNTTYKPNSKTVTVKIKVK
ncbi:MAG: Ig-like domain-containing protein [Ruminococcus sp.]|nr:Ig-like domain-containing protein [Ruminococcus sp.]